MFILLWGAGIVGKWGIFLSFRWTYCLHHQGWSEECWRVNWLYKTVKMWIRQRGLDQTWYDSSSVCKIQCECRTIHVSETGLMSTKERHPERWAVVDQSTRATRNNLTTYRLERGCSTTPAKSFEKPSKSTYTNDGCLLGWIASTMEQVNTSQKSVNFYQP